MTTNIPPTLDAGTIVQFPDGSRGWVHLEEYDGIICCFRAAHLGDPWHEMALYTPDALRFIDTPPLPWNEGRYAFEARTPTEAICAASWLDSVLGILCVVEADDQRPGWWLAVPVAP
jgi:hypothetical protein